MNRPARPREGLPGLLRCACLQDDAPASLPRDLWSLLQDEARRIQGDQAGPTHAAPAPHDALTDTQESLHDPEIQSILNQLGLGAHEEGLEQLRELLQMLHRLAHQRVAPIVANAIRDSHEEAHTVLDRLARNAGLGSVRLEPDRQPPIVYRPHQGGVEVPPWQRTVFAHIVEATLLLLQEQH